MEFLAGFDYIREAGTAGEEKAAALLQKTLSSFGVESRLEEFNFDTFKIKKAKLTITKPYIKEYTVTGYGRCGNTEEGGLKAPFMYVENGDDISLAHASGKIVMVNDPVRKDMYQKLVKAGAVGFINIVGSPLDEGVDLISRAYGLPRNMPGEEKKVAGKEAQNYDNRISGVSIHYKDAIELVTKGASQACLCVEQETVTRTSRNVVARIEGPGAYDNMSGGAIIMELCRYFHVHRPRRTMEFVWFGAEEKGLLGSQSYIKVHEAELPAHRFNMNVDLAGQLVGGTVVGVTGDASICSMITYMAHEIGIGMSTKNQIWGSDSNTFAWKGIPAMTLNRDGFGMHTRHDTIALLSDWSLERSAILLGYIADRLGNIDSIPFERKVPEDFIAQLDEYFG